MTPVVSVVVPAYQSAAHIGKTLSSVLAQTFEDLELVVVDDASTDGTVEVARSFPDDRLRVLANQTNVGPVENWNRAVAEARGRFVKLLCGDDVLYPTCIDRQVRALGAPDAAGAVMTACRRDILDEAGDVLIAGRGLDGLTGLVPAAVALRAAVRAGTNVFGEPAAVMVRAEALALCGPFSSRLPYTVDLDMWCRVLEHGDLVAVPEALCGFRVVATSWSVSLGRQQAAQARRLLADVRRRHPDEITRVDETLGRVRATTLAAGRRLLYRRLARRAGARADSGSRSAAPAGP